MRVGKGIKWKLNLSQHIPLREIYTAAAFASVFVISYYPANILCLSRSAHSVLLFCIKVIKWYWNGFIYLVFYATCIVCALYGIKKPKRKP